MNLADLADYRFCDTHEWVRGGLTDGRVGITDFAQAQLGDMVFFELPPAGKRLAQGDAFGVVESVKAASDLYAPVDLEIVEVNEALDRNPELVNHDPYGAGWLIRVRMLDPGQFDELLNAVSYRVDVTQEVEHIFYLDQANEIHYVPAVRSGDDLFITDSPAFQSIVVTGLITTERERRSQLAAEFERLINSPRLTESELRAFLAEHPEFLLGSDYARLHPQVMLPRPPAAALQPDFILQPWAGVSWEAGIVNVSLPSERIIRQAPRHPELYANILEAILQLRTYARYFESAENREYVRRELGFTAFQPRLTLVVGRSVEYDRDGTVTAALASARPVDIVTFDDLLTRYRAMANRS